MPVNRFEMTALVLEGFQAIELCRLNWWVIRLVDGTFGWHFCAYAKLYAYVANKVSIRQKHDTYIIGICYTDEAV